MDEELIPTPDFGDEWSEIFEELKKGNKMSNDTLMSPAIAKHSQQIAEVLSMKATVQDLLKSQMKEDVHFGKIPGTGDKPTLLKPGAEMLRMVFSLRTIGILEIKLY